MFWVTFEITRDEAIWGIVQRYTSNGDKLYFSHKAVVLL